jgi:uncharacterized protein
MDNYWIPLQSIPVGGKALELRDQDIWEGPIREFGLDCRIAEPLTARVTLLPQAEGILFRGRIAGAVIMPCDRCAADSLIRLDHSFDSFEAFPEETLTGNKTADPFGEADEAVIRNAPNARGIEVNPAALLWQEFSLALPVKPLCSEECQGLCPMCGARKSEGNCSCAKESGDPRLAALRGLTVKRR